MRQMWSKQTSEREFQWWISFDIHDQKPQMGSLCCPAIMLHIHSSFLCPRYYFITSLPSYHHPTGQMLLTLLPTSLRKQKHSKKRTFRETLSIYLPSVSAHLAPEMNLLCSHLKPIPSISRSHSLSPTQRSSQSQSPKTFFFTHGSLHSAYKYADTLPSFKVSSSPTFSTNYFRVSWFLVVAHLIRVLSTHCTNSSPLSFFL